MQTFAVRWLAGIAGLALIHSASAQGAEAGDIESLRAEIAALKTQYEGQIAALEQRLEQLEATAPATGAAVAETPAVAASAESAAPAAGGAAAQSANVFNPALSLILTGTYSNLSRDPEDYGIAGFIPASDEVGPGDGGFSLGESEVTISASVDPYFTAALTAALSGEGELEVEEAFFRTTSLPAGFTVKGGRFFSGVGYLNEVHAHAWDFVDQPLVYQAMFGKQLAQDGFQAKWLAPTDLFLEFGAEIGNGDSFPATRDGGNGFSTVALFGHVGGDIGDSIGWRAGLSYVDADALDREYEDTDALGLPVRNAFTGSSETWIVDATLKWAPGGDARRNALELQGEYLTRDETGRLGYDLDGRDLTSRYRSSQDGWYVQGTWRFLPRWRAGLRYDSLDSGTPRIGLVDDGTLSHADFPLLQSATPSRITLMTDWSPSEFTRLRAQYAWDDARDDGSTDEQWLLQYIYAIGAHGAHKF